jgi:L-asparaginase / beta-aspartyl-peptidase
MHDLHSGAIAGLQNVRNPVFAARAVLEQTAHHFLAGNGARRFAESCGVELCSMEELMVPRRIERYRQLMERGASFEGALDLEASDDPIYVGDETSDTVGACAIDASGRLAVASSTGGIMLKTPGRVGDVPVVGTGNYCGPAGAITCTGHGEAVMRVCLAKYVYDQLEQGRTAAEAARMGIDLLIKRVQGAAGLIVVDSQGRRAWATSTPRISVGIPEEILDQRSGVRD